MNDTVSLSHRLYRFLLQAYPPSFYAEYGVEMALTFRESCRAEYRQHGALGVIGKWTETIPDIVVSLADEHMQEEFQMAKTTLSRILAVAGVVGGALWVAYSIMLFMRAPGGPGRYRETDDLAPLVLFGLGLVTAGLLGIYLRPARSWTTPSRLLLLLAAGGLWTTFAPMITTNWGAIVAGMLVQVGGLLLVGLILLGQSATRQWAYLFIAVAITLFMFNSEDWRALFGAAAGIIAIALFALLLGDSLNRQSQPPMGTA